VGSRFSAKQRILMRAVELLRQRRSRSHGFRQEVQPKPGRRRAGTSTMARHRTKWTEHSFMLGAGRTRFAITGIRTRGRRRRPDAEIDCVGPRGVLVKIVIDLCSSHAYISVG
jgi:hypothetical protein